MLWLLIAHQIRGKSFPLGHSCNMSGSLLQSCTLESRVCLRTCTAKHPVLETHAQ